MNEAELLRAFRKDRSEEAFAELVRRYASLVYSVAHRRVANTALAEDVTQIVFIRFAKTPPNVHTHGELAAWLHRTTLNVAIDTWRSETRRRSREQQAVVMEPTTHSAWEDISPNLDEAVNQLNEEDRQAILLRFFGKKSMRDVGTTLGVSEAAAKMRVGRAVERLRTQLGVGGVACTAAVLGVLLVEHSVEAAPLPLMSRLAALRLPKLAGAAATGGVLLALFRIYKFKLAAGVAVLTLIGFGVAHLVRSSNTPPVLQASSDADAMPETRAPRQMNSAGAPTPAPSPKPPKILLHVLDAESGFGLPQTKIKFFYFGAGGQSESHETLTDDNGDAPLQGPDDPAKDSAPNVFVTAEGHVPKLVSPTTNDYVVRLDAALTIGGFVVDEHDLPIPGVEIFVDRSGNKWTRDGDVNFQTSTVMSHEDGSWTCSYIPKDSTNEFYLILKKPGYAMTCPYIPVPFAYSTKLTLVMDSGTLYTGKIIDERDRPIANARIKVLARDLRKRESTLTDENGAFILSEINADGTWPGSRFETNAAGGLIIRPQSRDKMLKGLSDLPFLHGGMQADLVVQADGFAPEKRIIQLTNADHTVNFTLSPGNYFRGRVVDDLGNPIRNVVVQTDYNLGGSEREFDWTTHTDANGMFQWDSAPAGKAAYWFEADGYAVLRGIPLAADNSDHEITLRRNAAR